MCCFHTKQGKCCNKIRSSTAHVFELNHRKHRNESNINASSNETKRVSLYFSFFNASLYHDSFNADHENKILIKSPFCSDPEVPILLVTANGNIVYRQ